MYRLVREASRDITLCTVDSSSTNAKIGRDPKTCAVQLGIKAVAVSREHAELQWSLSGVTIVDSSSFGTLVDGVKILKSSKLLKGGERLKIGQENFVLEKVEEVRKVPQISKPEQRLAPSKPAAKNSITSYFTKDNAVRGGREESQPAEISVRKILATETPSASQESQEAHSQVTSLRKAVRGGVRRVNPLFDFDDEDESILDSAIGKVLAAETPSDSVPSQKVSVPPRPLPPVLSPAPSPASAPTTTATQPSTAVDRQRKKVSLFAKQNQRPRTEKPVVVEDDDGMDVDVSLANATSQWDDGFARPSVPRTRSRTSANQSSERIHPADRQSPRGGIGSRRETGLGNYSDDIMEVNPSSIPTQPIPTARKPIVTSRNNDGGFGSEPQKKKAKSLFAEPPKKLQRMQSNKPKEKSLLDEDDNGVLNIRYDYVAPKPVIGERAYSTIENLRAMDQMGRDAKARMEKKLGLDKIDEMESQYPSVEELTSILCSSHTEDNEEEKEKKEGEVERVGDETLDEETKSQLVTFCDSLVVSQPSSDTMASANPSQGRGFKKFKKAKQGRFATQTTVFSGIIGGSDLVDFREIHF